MSTSQSPWLNPPDFMEVQRVMIRYAEVRAKIESLQHELDILQAKMAKQKPRTAYVKIIGVDEESEFSLLQLQQELVNSRAEFFRLQSERDFYDYWKDVYKAASFSAR